jgi:uncharacterized protein YdcH (DUF465 family)
VNLCSNDHEEVCYEAADCPVCEMESTKDDEIADLKKEVAKLKDEIVILDRRLEAEKYQ